jgi:hypothetical protein
MTTAQLIREIIATYTRHGWLLQRVLLQKPTQEQLALSARDILAEATVQESDFDALWFSRSSHAKREAWELRLIAAQPYALFEAFEEDESEEDRDEARREMENRMRKFAKRE